MTTIPVTEPLRPDDFDRDGFVVVRNVLAPDEVLELRQFLMEALQRFEHTGDASIGIQTETTECEAIWPDFYQHNPAWFGMLCRERVVGPLHQLLGPSFILTRDSVAHWGYFPGWHTDTTTTEVAGSLTHRTDPEWRMLTVGFYLQSGAGLCVVPGSHRAPDPFVALRRQHRGDAAREWSPAAAYDIPTEAGDLVIFDMRIIHRASSATARAPDGSPCRKLAVFSRASRCHPRHVAEYSDFRFNGAGTTDRSLAELRAQAARWGFELA